MYAFHVLPSWSHAYSLVEADSHVQNLIGDTKCQSSTPLVAIGSVFTQKKRRNFFSAWTLIGCLSVDRTWKLLLGLLNQKVSQSVLMLDIYWCNNVFWTKYCFWIGSSGALPINKTIFFKGMLSIGWFTISLYRWVTSILLLVGWWWCWLYLLLSLHLEMVCINRIPGILAFPRI